MNKKIKFRLGDVIFADLGPKRNRCLAGQRRCIFLGHTNFSVSVIPLTSLFSKEGVRKLTFDSDLIIEGGVANLRCDSIIRVHECKNIDVLDIDRKTGRLPDEFINLLLEKYHSLLPASPILSEITH
ncbi:MAG: type II toxin-antitoxin system PemK/MazF family toxin [Saprospiraceae bacterium]